MNRRSFLAASGLFLGGVVLPIGVQGASDRKRTRYPYFGRTEDYQDFRILDPGSKIKSVESWTRGSYGIVRVQTETGESGWGQLSSYEPDISALVLHRQVARHVIGGDPARIDDLADRVMDANMKFPWSYVCRAFSGVDTAIWDLYGKLKSKPVYGLLGADHRSFPVYGSSMRRDISPADEADRLLRLREEFGFEAFKIRLGTPVGHDQDAAPGRTEAIISLVRKRLGNNIRLLADGNSCYTPPKAIDIGRIMEANAYYWFEEPCPYWELEWTAEVARALKMNVAGGEQDNDMAQWRRMIRLNAVDIVQPDLCYNGGFTRSFRVAKLAEKARKMVVPHSSHLSLITVFSLHLMKAIPNAGPFVEYSIEPMSGNQAPLYSPALKVEAGRVKLPEAPGWGVEINPRWLEGADYRKTPA